MVLAVCAASLPSVAPAQTRPVLLRDSFPIGSGAGVLCQVQDHSAESQARQTLFDRAWTLVCRDSAQPVAKVFAFHSAEGDPVSLIAPYRREKIECGDAATTQADGLTRQECLVAGTQLGWSIFRTQKDGVNYIAEGFTAYDSATRLALQSVVENRIAQGQVSIATTSIADPLAFARVQAESLQPEQALAEGYRRNLSGEYAEAAAYFETLQDRLEREGIDAIDPSEFLLNRALQKSNLGQFAEAERLFDLARPQSAGDPLTERLQRNFEAIHQLNRDRPKEALLRVKQPLSEGGVGVAMDQGVIEISVPVAQRLNSGENSRLLSMAGERRLSLRERTEIIDAQALQIAGTAQHMLGNDEAAAAALIQANARALAVRGGRVTTIARMRSQILGSLGLIAEDQGDLGTAEAYLRSGLAILKAQYPERRAVSGAEARLADFLLRHDRRQEALALYDGVVERMLGNNSGATGFANRLAPYFRYLAESEESDPKAAERFFLAAQLLIRPGVAETQAVLSRKLSAGSDDASRLFRQSTDLAREVEQLRISYLALSRAEQSSDVVQRSNELAQRIEQLEQAQVRTVAQLAQYPQYRVTAPRAINLADFRTTLRPGEAYARIAAVGDDLYMFFTTADTAHIWEVPLSGSDLDFYVDMLRASISIEQNGRYVTYPFDIERSRELYKALFGPVSGEMATVDHLIFEPDGALLRLPIDLLVTDDASLATYESHAQSDPYDFTGVAWLGRDRRISTAVSAQGFVDARKESGSDATNQYLGLGSNEPLGEIIPSNVRAMVASGDDSCGWRAASWNQPIDKRELVVARDLIGASQSELITGAAFTDTHIKHMDDLDDYRILHFATHGLVTPPRPECPVEPALLTSFGAEQSDGLLTFEEIFDLGLDADLVILSACDTAGGASVEATRSAGLGRGGGTALDGLVRAFVGAGGRTILASHWPAPDDYNATTRLMSAMFRAGAGTSIGDALKHSQQLLMDDPETSHPYYWAGFSLIGDASRPLLPASPESAPAQDNNNTGASTAAE